MHDAKTCTVYGLSNPQHPDIDSLVVLFAEELIVGEPNDQKADVADQQKYDEQRDRPRLCSSVQPDQQRYVNEY